MRILYEFVDLLRHRARLKEGNAAHAWGRRGEDLAHRKLRALGYTILARNHRNRGGTAEVDLIARDGDTLVFVEVKTRATDAFGAPEEAVDLEKRAKITRGAADYIYRSGQSWDRVRFDIVSVLFTPEERVIHHTDAFRATTQL